jgi:hypothetical protein
MRRWPQLLMLGGLLLLAVAWWDSGHLPPRDRLLGAVLQEPLQTPTQTAPFKTEVGGVEYGIKPVFDYDIAGLIVSRHDSATWWDYIHAASHDHINVADLCLVWGANAADGAYLDMSFSSGQFVCYFQAHSADSAQPQYFRALSNNHLLAADPALAKRIAGLHVGDQVRLRGHLVEYTHHQGFEFHRGTSVTRDDTGNGACETIFVRELSVLRTASPLSRLLFWSGLAFLACGILGWFAQPYRADDAD